MYASSFRRHFLLPFFSLAMAGAAIAAPTEAAPVQSAQMDDFVAGKNAIDAKNGELAVNSFNMVVAQDRKTPRTLMRTTTSAFPTAGWVDTTQRLQRTSLRPSKKLGLQNSQTFHALRALPATKQNPLRVAMQFLKPIRLTVLQTPADAFPGGASFWNGE